MAELVSLNSDRLSVASGFQQCQDTAKDHESLMARCRAKATNKEQKLFKSWIELTKALRLAITDKRNVIDNVERSNLQKALDTLQKPIKVTSLQSMVERLDSIARQQGLKFTRLSTTHCCISSDIFCVEVLLEHSGAVSDVKIAHSEAPVSCPELTKVLRSGCFTEFTKHLEGLSAIYQLNADSTNQLDSEAQKLKKKAYAALYYLEHDLSQLWQLQRSIKESSNLVHKSPVGILQERQGGYPLRLTYFVSPYDLLDLKTKSSITLTVDAVVEKGLGRSVTVGIESSNTHKLQSASLITVSNNGEKSLPSNAAHSNLNSTELPASFVLKLQEPVPMAVSILKKIQGVTKISNSVDLSNSQSLLYVIINDTSKGKIPCSGHKRLLVALPDQHHCYTMKSNPDLQGVLVSSIPFTHPAHVPQILDFLRQQMLFNTVISSCVRPRSKKADIESALKFDIHAYSTNHIQVTFVHPLDESLATVDLDLKKITGVKCEIHTLGMDNSLCTDDYASKIMQRCLSIPVTMRAVIRKAQGQQQQKKPEPNDLYCTSVGGGTDVSYLPHMPNYGSRLSNGSSLTGGHFSNLASRMCNKPMDELDLISAKAESVAYGLMNRENNPEVSLNAGIIDQHNVVSSAEKIVDAQVEKLLIENKNASLPSFILQGENCNETSKSANPMLLSMLNDVPSAAPSSTALSLSAKPRKRKASDGRGYGSVGKSPKRKMSEESSSNRDLPNFDCSSSDSVSAAVDKTLGLPSSFSSSDESCHVVRGPASVEPYVKNDLPLAYPQRSASTDSYLSFRSQQVLSNSENSNPELLSISSQIKNPSIFASDSDQPGSDSNLDLDSESFCEKTSFSEKSNSDKCGKKFKKSKEVADNQEVLKVQDFEGSEGSSSSDFFHKSFADVDNSLSEDSKVSNFTNVQKPVVISTNLKIAKTTDGHKVSKSESKIKQKEGRRSGESTSGRKKSDGKKERKKKQIQASEGMSNQISCHPLQCADASLMPPPTSTELSSSSGSVCDTQPKRPITLNVKTSSSSQSKSLVAVSASSHATNVSPKGSFSKTSPDKTGVKLSRVSQSLGMGKTVNSLRDGELSSVAKVIGASLKLPSKHKQSSTTKSTSGISHSAGQSSPNKSKPTLKLKNSSLSHAPSTGVSSAVAKSCPQSHSSVSVSPSPDEPTSPGKQSSSKSHKSQLRSGKGSLSAVIDKLRVTATNAQQLPENVRPNSEVVEKKESKLERKEGMKDGKEGQQAKPAESKNKYCSSDQFTVKQSSQGIKLTVTKTRLSDGSTKSTKLKPSGMKTDSSGSAINPAKSSSGSATAKKPPGTSPVSVKKPHMNLHPNSSHKTIRCATTSGNPAKTVVIPGHKIISPGGPSSLHKVISSNVKALKPNKVSSIIQQSKKKIPHLNESKCTTANDIAGKSSSSAINVQSKMVTTLSAKMPQNVATWAVSNVLKQSEEQFDTQRYSHADAIEEADRETTFKLLMEQSKNEGQNGSEQAQPTSKSSDFAVQLVPESKLELENKEFIVSSTVDSKKSPNVFRLNQVPGNTAELNISSGIESKPIVAHSDMSVKKHDGSINPCLVNSEQVGKNLSAFNIAAKPSEGINIRSEDSSPEDDLIIDYPGTPRMQDQKRNYQGKKKDISPEQKKVRVDSIMADKINEKFEYPQSSFISKPLEQLSPSTSNHSHTIPVESWPLDDDLMNMALTMGK